MKNISVVHRQSGAVSLFVVIFATLLITVVTLGFLRIMVNDQNQATNNDLAQSAYDSAQAGVEDAKRALLKYKTICDDESRQGECEALVVRIEDAGCNEALRFLEVIPSGDGEVVVEQTQGGSSDELNQAYTCVKMVLRTDDYVGSLSANTSKLIPLVAVKDGAGNRVFDSVKIEWYSLEDVGNNAGTVSLQSLGQGAQKLSEKSTWPVNRPSVLRSQLIQVGSSFTLTDFDAQNSGSNANTLFLAPTSSPSAPSYAFAAQDTRRASLADEFDPAQTSSAPLAIHCESIVPVTIAGKESDYACSATLTLPTPIGGGNRTAFLRLTPYFNSAHFRVTMYNAGTLVKFDSVQPIVDSTGRADTLFRRVQGRVDLIDTSFPYPDGTVETSGNLCKDMSITDKESDYSSSCTP